MVSAGTTGTQGPPAPRGATDHPAPATARRLDAEVGALAREALTRIEQAVPWWSGSPAERRAQIGLVVQAGVATFARWFREGATPEGVEAAVFGAAPRELARAVTLQETVELVRITVDVVEERVAELAAPGEASVLREAVLRYSRDVAFAAARVYASAAEERGAWDARQEALLVDAVLRGEIGGDAVSRAAALGWGTPGAVAVLVGTSPDGDIDVVLDGVRRAARHSGRDALSGVAGDRLVAVLAAADDADVVAAAQVVEGCFADGPLVLGPTVADLGAAGSSAAEALAGLRAARARPELPRPVHAGDLLPERVVSGDPSAREALAAEVLAPLLEEPDLLATVSAYVEQGRSVEGTARALFLHPNTVRYRLRKVADLTGCVPTDPRGAFVLQLAVLLGRLDG